MAGGKCIQLLVGHGESLTLVLTVMGSWRSYLNVETALYNLCFKRISLAALFEKILERGRDNKQPEKQLKRYHNIKL